jgi:hypothetical protein
MASLLRFIVVCTYLLLSACSQQALIDKLTPHPAAEIAQSVLEQVRKGDIEPVKARLGDALQNDPDIDIKLKKLTSYFPAGAPRSVKLIGSNTMTVNGNGRYDLTYEYEFAGGWALGNVVLAGKGDAIRVEGVHVQRMAQSLEQLNTFTLNGKGAEHWIVLLACIAIPVFCLYAFVLCLRTPIARRKWLWALGTLLGFATLRFNWTTGAFDFQLLSIQLFGSSGVSNFYGPVIMGVSLPLGAIWFLVHRRELLANAAAAKAAEIPVVREQD